MEERVVALISRLSLQIRTMRMQTIAACLAPVDLGFEFRRHIARASRRIGFWWILAGFAYWLLAAGLRSAFSWGLITSVAGFAVSFWLLRYASLALWRRNNVR